MHDDPARPCSGPAHHGVGGLSVGVDVVDIARFADLHQRRSTLSVRLFTDEERAYAATKADPAATLAGMWAAKEAWCKARAVAVRAVGVHRLEVAHDPCGAPRLTYDGHPLAASVSISHDGPVAVAVVVAVVVAGPSAPAP